MPTNCLKYTVILVLLILFVETTNCFKKPLKQKLKRKSDNLSVVSKNSLIPKKVSNYTNYEQSRGFFAPGLLSLGKVLNFFPVGGERECQPSKYTAARAGICLNQYDCRQRDGRAAGDCAHGLGVCCVFEVTCGGVVQHNLTYFISPGFPELWMEPETDCTITVDKTHAGVTQLRIDFVHFTIAQPNRTTGECEEDAMTFGEGEDKFVVCGQNHGQHMYLALPSAVESRDDDGLPSAGSTKVVLRRSTSDVPRVWLIRIAQLPLAHNAPLNCRQYHTRDQGTIKTFNFASNGRHLAGQDYKICVRKNLGFCAVRYSPCDQQSFRIGPGLGDRVTEVSNLEIGPGGYGGSGTGFYGPDGQFVPYASITQSSMNTQNPDLTSQGTQNDPMQPQQMMPVQETVDDQMQEVEGSGDDAEISEAAPAVAPPSLAARIWSFIWPSWLWGQQARGWGWNRWSPYTPFYTREDDRIRYTGYGHFGFGLNGHGRLRCTDRITIPCENEYFVSSTSYGPGVCDPHHCGSSFCNGDNSNQCEVESSITPFAVSVHFGPPTPKKNPEDNIGACLKYTQVPCDS